MADLTYSLNIEPDSSVSEALITMAQSKSTTSSIVASFNQTATSQTCTFNATSAAESLITIAQSKDKTESGLTQTFSYAFVSQLVFDIIVNQALSKQVSGFDPAGIPIIFYTKTNSDPILFYTRTNAEPIVFHERGTTQRIKDSIQEGLTVEINDDDYQAEQRVLSSSSRALITMDQSQNETESGCVATFSTSVA